MRCVSRFVCRGLVGTSLVALACGLGAGAQALTVDPLVKVTGADPFSGCTRDNVTSQEAAYDSILYPNTAIEPWVALDPTNAKRLLVGHQQDRWNNGGSRGLVGNVSSDSGSTWTNTIPGDVSKCTGGDFARASDPWVTFAKDGTAFFFSLVAEQVQGTSGLGERHGGMLVSRSIDHAATWEAPITLIRDNDTHEFNDKNSITADPTANGFVYAVWDRLEIFPLTPGAAAEADALLAINDGVEIAREMLSRARTASAGGAPFFTFAFTGPTFFAMTSNNGDAWSTARPIFEPGTGVMPMPGFGAQTINNLVVVLPKSLSPTEDVLDFFTFLDFTTTPTTKKIAYIRSKDKGANWSKPTFVFDIKVNDDGIGVITPDSGQRVRDAEILYSVAVDPASGALYLAWQDDRFSSATCAAGTRKRQIDGIVFSQSFDGGMTWSAPVQINQTPPNALHPCRQQAFVPAVVVASDGTVVVTYYDFRFDMNTPAGFEATDYFALFCKSGGCDSAASWTDERRLTTSSFNILDAPVARGHFLGDYMGLAADASDHVFPVFGIATGHNITADFTRKITLP